MSMRSGGQLLCITVLASGCQVFERSCTEIGCGDQASLTLATADRKWPAGAYRFRYTLPDAVITCEVSVPEQLPARTSISARCSSGSMHLAPHAVCVESRTADAVTQSCSPADGELIGSVSFDGTPSNVGIQVERHGVVILDKEERFAYASLRPNGPDCEPLCRQASVSVLVP